MQSFQPSPSFDDHCRALIERGYGDHSLQIDVGSSFVLSGRWPEKAPDRKDRGEPRPPGVQPDEEILERSIPICVLYRDAETNLLTNYSGKLRQRVWVGLAEQIMGDR